MSSESFSHLTSEQIAAAEKMLKGTDLEHAGLVGDTPTETGLAKKPSTVFESFGGKTETYSEDEKGRVIPGLKESKKAEAWLKKRGSSAGEMELL